MEPLRVDVLDALNRLAPIQELLEIIRRYKGHGASQKETYDTLQALWIELGCQGTNDETAKCSLLGAVMDRVWGFCSATDSIWDTNLSDEQRPT